jgi:hypothetical protein
MGGVYLDYAVAWQESDARFTYTVKFYRPDVSLETTFYNKHIKGNTARDIYQMHGSYNVRDPRLDLEKQALPSIQPEAGYVVFTGVPRTAIDESGISVESLIEQQQVEVQEYAQRYSHNVEYLRSLDGGPNPPYKGAPYLDGSRMWDSVWDGTGTPEVVRNVGSIIVDYTDTNRGSAAISTYGSQRFHGLKETYLTQTEKGSIVGGMEFEYKHFTSVGNVVPFLGTILFRWFRLATYENVKITDITIVVAGTSGSQLAWTYDHIREVIDNSPITSYVSIIQVVKDVVAAHYAYLKAILPPTHSALKEWEDPRIVNLTISFSSGVLIDTTPDMNGPTDNNDILSCSLVRAYILSAYPPNYGGPNFGYSLYHKSVATFEVSWSQGIVWADYFKLALSSDAGGRVGTLVASLED